jgi:hypothetical protein
VFRCKDAVKKSVNGSANLIFRGLALTVRGKVTEEAGQFVLQATETNERFLLVGAGSVGGSSKPTMRWDPRQRTVAGGEAAAVSREGRRP